MDNLRINNAKIVSDQRAEDPHNCHSNNAVQGRRNAKIINKVCPGAIQVGREAYKGKNPTDPKIGTVFVFPSLDELKRTMKALKA